MYNFIYIYFTLLNYRTMKKRDFKGKKLKTN